MELLLFKTQVSSTKLNVIFYYQEFRVDGRLSELQMYKWFETAKM